MAQARLRIWMAAVLAGFLAGPALGDPRDDAAFEQRGKASFYHDKFDGKRTATGEVLDQDKLTAASPSLPMGARVTVTNEENGRSVDVRVNDRGPFVGGRVIDLSGAAAERLDMKQDGLAQVKVVARPSAQPTQRLKEKVRQKAAAKAKAKPAAKPAAKKKVAANR